MLLFFFLIIDLYFLIPGVIAQIYNSITDLEIPIGIPSKKGNAEIEIHLAAAETKIESVQYFRVGQFFLFFFLINSFWPFFQENNFLFHLYFSF